jgi:hypothetical protein
MEVSTTRYRLANENNELYSEIFEAEGVDRPLSTRKNVPAGAEGVVFT